MRGTKGKLSSSRILDKSLRLLHGRIRRKKGITSYGERCGTWANWVNNYRLNSNDAWRSFLNRRQWESFFTQSVRASIHTDHFHSMAKGCLNKDEKVSSRVKSEFHQNWRCNGLLQQKSGFGDARQMLPQIDF